MTIKEYQRKTKMLASFRKVAPDMVALLEEECNEALRENPSLGKHVDTSTPELSAKRRRSEENLGESIQELNQVAERSDNDTEKTLKEKGL